ncbi:immunoglobulin superfamily containing leucine-rich repeat protein-like [Pecten maximus]|uniref:immunoglobulin superfamily containing leucine-rich repeat protein-like n=1 Tax=Pecten maximus TaxID=6579 RepID=UPI001458E191|nr:immunoglobulin superfamily containing leucine-rich repeat protein-like [Pecten maximus]
MIVNVTNNLLTEFPTCGSVGDISCVSEVHLDFSHNFLQALPNNETCILDKAVMLNVSHNRFTEIPEPIANSSTLQYLVMAYNKISKITPRAFVGLPYLKELDLSFNHLTVFPESIKSLSRLEKLNLAGNLILTIPDIRSSLWPSLSVFQFHGNPLVCSCSAVWLRNYTFTTDLGQCSYPVEHEGSAVTCLATLPCDTGQSVYSSKENIQACRTGLVLTNENQNLKWDLPSGRVQTTPQSQANVEVFRDCYLVANFSSVGENTWEVSYGSNETGDLVCLTLSDKTWISNIRECLVLDPTGARPVVATEQNSVEAETQTSHTAHNAVIITLSIILVAVIGTGLAIYIVCKRRRQAVTKHRGTVPTISGEENTVYENGNVGETSFSGGPVDSAEDEHYYDSLHPSNT